MNIIIAIQKVVQKVSWSYQVVQPCPQAPPRFYLAAMEKNLEKAWEQNYVTTGNGGLGYYVMWTRFLNDGNLPTHNVAGIGQFNPSRHFCQQLRTSQVPSH